jgi:peptidoglycan hydrolase-like protein with peptidoglycan-binding domain
VPSHIRVVEAPDTLIEIHPEWRGHRYFVVRDEIVIVDSGHRIVATLPVGETASDAQLNGNRGARLSNDRDEINLSSDEIRELQITLREKGFYDGEPDGNFGPQTRQALMTFQQRQGLQASGRLDAQTTAALGISTKNGERGNGGQPSTTGQGNGPRQPSANDGRPAGNQGMSSGPNNRDGNQPSTTGQGGEKMKQQPPANQDVGNAQPGDQGRSSTTGEGNATPSPNMNQNSGAAQRSGGQAK